MKSVSVLAAAPPERVWQIYSQLRWQEWDHDIKSMQTAAGDGQGQQGTDGGGAAGVLCDGLQLTITMADGKQHTATLGDVAECQSFTYTAPLPGGAQLVAVHKLVAVASGDSTKITHSFGFTGWLGPLYRLLTMSYVAKGLAANTAELKALAERPGC